MFSLISNSLSLDLRSPRVLIAAGVGLAAAAGIAGFMLTRHKPTAEELERERRDLLALTGRITDGTILDTIPDTSPDTIPDRIQDRVPDRAESKTSDSVATMSSPDVKSDADVLGVEIAVAGIAESRAFRPEKNALPPPHIIIYNYRIAGVSYECAQDVSMLAERVNGIRTDLPIQVRYAPHNPGNSIVVAETWSGLRLISANPLHSDSGSHTS